MLSTNQNIIYIDNIFFEEAKMKLYINNESFVPSAQGVLEGNDHNYTRDQSKVTKTENQKQLAYTQTQQRTSKPAMNPEDMNTVNRLQPPKGMILNLFEQLIH